MPASICDVLPAAASLLGVGLDRAGLVGHLAPCRRVAVVLVDGMGSALLPAMAPHAPLLAGVLAGEVGRLDELVCTFPSTTPTSLVSLGTGTAPGAHGVLGFTVNVPGTDRILTHIVWRDDPPPRTWQPVPTWFQHVAGAGYAAKVVLPGVFRGSGLTDAAYRGAEFCGLAKAEDPAGRLLRELEDSPGLVVGYLAALDTAAHRFGVASPEWHRAAVEVDAYLTGIVDGLPDDAALLVTADHGGLNAAPEDRVDLDAVPDLAAGLRAVAGEPRVRYLHTRPGAAEDVLHAWRAVLGERVEVYLRDEAVALGLFGPVASGHLPRIGDVVAIGTGNTVVLAGAHEPPEVARLIGFHGARTPAEMAIPLITLAGA